MKLNSIYQGDAITLMKRLPRGSVNLIITDPPYNIGMNYRSYKDLRHKEAYSEWSRQWLLQASRVLRKDGTLYVINYPENNASLLAHVDGAGLKFRSWLVWHYPSNIGISPRNFTRSQRCILFLTKSSTYTFNKIPLSMARNKRGDVLRYNMVKNTSKEKVDFPCQIPQSLIELLLTISSNTGDLVLDPFSGSGTTSLVAKRMGRKYLGFDMDAKYVVMASCRIAKEK